MTHDESDDDFCCTINCDGCSTSGCKLCKRSCRCRPGARFETKDSGVRAEYASGMVRDTEEGKARFDLLFPLDVPYASQMMTRFAELMARGAKKYDARNWEKAKGAEELARYRSSALRHLVQWAAGETDEDHAAAVMFNLMAGETVKFKMEEAGPDLQFCGFEPRMGEGARYGECLREPGHDGAHRGRYADIMEQG